MMLVVDIDEGNMMESYNFKVVNRRNTEFFYCQSAVGNVFHNLT
jgi:hypothetical protein